MTRPTPLAVRFWAKVDKTPGHGPRGDCWLWTAGLRSGYGRINGGRNGRGGQIGVYAHRLAFELATGRPPAEGMEVCHTCDVKACVNPAHLWEGRHAQNMADMSKKGRARGRVFFGEDHPNSKLTAADVLVIRSSKGPLKEVAAQFGVAISVISGIRRRRSWSWLTESALDLQRREFDRVEVRRG